MLKRAAALTLCAAMLVNLGCSVPAGFESDARADAISDINIGEEDNAKYGAVFSPGAGATSYAMAYAEAFAKYLTNNNFCLYIDDELVQRQAMQLIDDVIGGEAGGGVLCETDDSGEEDLVQFIGEYDPAIVDKFNEEWLAMLSADSGAAEGDGSLAFFSPGAYSKAYAQAVASAYAAFLCSNTVNVYVNGKPEIVTAPVEPAQLAEGQKTPEETFAFIKESLSDDPSLPVRAHFSPGANTREYSAALARATASFFSGNTIHIYLDGTKNPNAPAPAYTTAMVHTAEFKQPRLKNAAAFTVTANGFVSDHEEAVRTLGGLVLALADAGIPARICEMEANGTQSDVSMTISVDAKNEEAARAVFADFAALRESQLIAFLPEFFMTLDAADAPKRALSAEDSLTVARAAFALFNGADGAVFTEASAVVSEEGVSLTTIIGSRTEDRLAQAQQLLTVQASLAGFETSFG